jgi:membrane protease YdiL (CAAX protease family)
MTDPAPAKQPPNPYEASVVAPEIVAAEVVPYFEPPFVRPRVWTVFVTIVAAFVAMIAVSFVGGVGLAIALVAGGTRPADLQKQLIDLLTAPPAFIGLGLVTQFTLAATAFAAAWLSPQPLAQRLGFVRPRWAWWETLVVNVGSLVPFAIGMSGAVALTEVLDPDPTAANLMKSMTAAWVVPYVLFISLAPGFSEEMLFRGYAQRRLIERWGGWTAILVTSTIFALIHLAPHTIVFAFPVGIWLGLMAWRSGSVWPGVIAHAAINGLWNAYNIAREFEYLPEEPSWAALGALGVIGVAAFAWSIAIMSRTITDTPASRVLRSP